MGSPVGVWFPLFLCVIWYAVHAPPPRLQRPLVPFSVWPQRHIRHCLKYCKWDTESRSPNKGLWKKNNRIIGLNPEVNILLYVHGLVSKQQSKPLRPWHKKVLCLSWGFFVYLFSFRTLSVSHNVQKMLNSISSCWWIMNRVGLKVCVCMCVRITLIYWPSMQQDFHLKNIIQSDLATPDLIEAVAMNALKSLHVFLKTALMHAHGG